MSQQGPYRTFSWTEVVEAADDKNRLIDSLYPVVYIFSNGRLRRDSGPESGVYEKET